MRRGIFFIALLSLFACFDVSYAKTFVVNSSGDDDVCAKACTLRGALSAADGNGESDRIYIHSSVKKIQIHKHLSIEHDDTQDSNTDILIRGNAVIQGGFKDRIFTIGKDADVILAGIQITGGRVHTDINADGAGILNFGDLKLYHVHVYGNIIQQSLDGETEAYVRGAGVFNAGGAKLYMYRTNIGPRNYLDARGYDAAAYGAGLYNAGKLFVKESNISGNFAYTRSHGDQGYAKSRGAGLYNASLLRMDIQNSSIYGNTVKADIVEDGQWAKAQGAGMYFKHSGELYMTNSTVSTNKAIAYGYLAPYSFTFAHGGGVYAGAYAKLYFANTTVADNEVLTPLSTVPDGTAVGSGVFAVKVPKTDIVFKNSIMSNPGKNCNHALDSEGHNISVDTSCKFNGVGDQQNTDPLLFALGNNGGFTKTQLLSNISSALNAGNPAGCYDFEGQLLAFDQRGYKRPKIGCDSGAVEK